MEIVPYKAEHLTQIILQPGQQHMAEWVSAEHAQSLESTDAYTVMVDGVPVACGGVFEHWKGRYEAWSYISEGLGGKLFLRIHHAVLRFFAALPCNRIEAYVDHQFAEGHRWAAALGFECECPRLKKYWPDGRDAALYVRVA